ncbi:MAG TPA: Asp-tRNA(Asn)/Glu-tRNA(Gln) amidotransferase subunit GatA [Chitinophagaceae bacterium]|nr:Asp-tRNA(Asn)/Glu-tRNA(Gln) amidotransferase subunit GatA [Chitinophagaceae bacterium]
MYQHQSIRQFHQDIANGTIECTQVVQHYLSRIATASHLNAFVEVFNDEALERASELDRKKRSGASLGKLFGVVIGIKDVICYKGHKVTAASRILEGFTSLYSATAVERLLAEDAIIIGSLNCDEFAMGSSNEHSSYGKVLNAIDESRVPGGSSGGSAVAVQAGLCMVSLGSDTGGSVRQPADFCGIVGLKPTYGRISRHGLIAYASSFDQIGIFSTNVDDAALLLEVMAGADEFDSTVSSEPVPAYSQHLSVGETYRIAYFEESLEHPSLDPEIKTATYRLFDLLRQQGHTVSPVSFEFLDYIVPAYYVLTTAEASSNLSRFDGVKYGPRINNPSGDLTAFYQQNRSAGFGKEVKRRIMLGNFVLSSGYYDAYFTQAQKVRRLIINKTDEVFRDHDLLLMPTVPAPAFPFGDKNEDPIEMFLADLFTVYANLSGIPAISIPLSSHSNGMPFGVQVMTNRFKELTLLRASKSIPSPVEPTM